MRRRVSRGTACHSRLRVRLGGALAALATGDARAHTHARTPPHTHTHTPRASAARLQPGCLSPAAGAGPRGGAPRPRHCRRVAGGGIALETAGVRRGGRGGGAGGGVGRRERPVGVGERVASPLWVCVGRIAAGGDAPAETQTPKGGRAAKKGAARSATSASSITARGGLSRLSRVAYMDVEVTHAHPSHRQRTQEREMNKV